MPWIRLEIPCPPELTEIVAAFVLSETGRGASIAAAGPETVVEAWVPELEALAVRERLAARLSAAGPPLADLAGRIRGAPVPDVDWRLTWREHFRSLRVGERLVIKPSWESWPPADDPALARDDDLVIEIDPGGAFGTGGHQTTQLALRALERRVGQGDTVIDVGCGSGILSLAALALGATRVIAIDSDCAAVECASADLKLLVQGDGLSCVRLAAEVVVANISAEGAVAVGRQVAGALEPGGTYIATGFLAEAARRVREELARLDLALKQADELEGWSCLTLTWKGSSNR
jgi:ribosomal protein L11 methyltransferase